MRSSLAPSGKALRRYRALERKASQPFSVWTLIPATLCHKQQHRGCLVQSAAGHESWLSLGTRSMGTASKTKGSTFQAVARRCGYLTKLRLPFLYSLLADPFRAAASLTPSRRAKCSRQHRELYPADTSIFTQRFSRVPQGMLAAEEEAAASS